jgi:hypothetical protein
LHLHCLDFWLRETCSETLRCPPWLHYAVITEPSTETGQGTLYVVKLRHKHEASLSDEKWVNRIPSVIEFLWLASWGHKVGLFILDYKIRC